MFNTRASRDLLLKDLSFGLVGAISRSDTTSIDLAEIVSACLDYRTQDIAEHPGVLLIENAQDLLQDGLAYQDLTTLKEQLQQNLRQAAPPTVAGDLRVEPLQIGFLGQEDLMEVLSMSRPTIPDPWPPDAELDNQIDQERAWFAQVWREATPSAPDVSSAELKQAVTPLPAPTASAEMLEIPWSASAPEEGDPASAVSADPASVLPLVDATFQSMSKSYWQEQQSARDAVLKDDMATQVNLSRLTNIGQYERPFDPPPRKPTPPEIVQYRPIFEEYLLRLARTLRWRRAVEHGLELDLALELRSQADFLLHNIEIRLRFPNDSVVFEEDDLDHWSSLTGMLELHPDFHTTRPTPPWKARREDSYGLSGIADSGGPHRDPPLCALHYTDDRAKVVYNVVKLRANSRLTLVPAVVYLPQTVGEICLISYIIEYDEQVRPIAGELTLQWS